MENASDALIMAGQVLIFIIALTICISSFTTLRVGIDSAIDQTETIKLAKNSDLYINFVQSRENGSTRIVGAETVVSSMYRSIKEDFVMYLKLKPSTFDLARVAINNYNHSHGETDTLLYQIKYVETSDEVSIKITISPDANSNPDTILKTSVYEAIQDKKFYEYLGEYQEKTSDAVSSENKLTRRIITYKEID